MRLTLIWDVFKSQLFKNPVILVIGLTLIWDVFKCHCMY